MKAKIVKINDQISNLHLNLQKYEEMLHVAREMIPDTLSLETPNKENLSNLQSRIGI